MRIGFFGTPEHAKELLDVLVQAGIGIGFVVTNPDKPQGRKKEMTPSPVKTYAVEKGIPVFQPAHWRDEALVRALLEIPVSAHIVYAYGKIIPESIFSSPIYGSINLHGSLLPKYRGASPVQTALLQGEKSTGFSIQFLSREVDSGAILYSEEFPIEDGDNTGSLLKKITLQGGKAILDLLQNPSVWKGQARVQDSSQASFCKKIESADRVLDFNQPARKVHNHVRALFPNPVCYTGFRGKRILIRETFLPTDIDLAWDEIQGKPGDKKSDGLPLGVPGTLVRSGKKSLFVICGDKNMIGIRELQPEGKKPMAAQDFLNGFPALEGEMFS